ncbi:MAG: sigma 54-interacting transcriptional regulator [Pseudomonadota bacterium]
MKTPPFAEVWINQKRKRFYLFKDEGISFTGDNFVVNADKRTQFPSLLFSFTPDTAGTPSSQSALKVSVLNQDRDFMLLAGAKRKIIEITQPTFFNFMNHDLFIDNVETQQPFSMTGVYSDDIFSSMEYSRSDRTIFIIGDTGTGKELLAKNIHYNSVRRHEPFRVINCSSLEPNIAERTLFGNVRGAFTDAVCDSDGEFMSAGQGTLVIDDIGSLPLGIQPLLLRALELKEIKPVGSDVIKQHNARIIVTSIYSPKELLYKWMLRKDLYYRIEECCVYLSELKNKPELITKLAEFFAGSEYIFTQCAKNKLLDYKWPGNIRELKNVIERAKALSSIYSVNKQPYKIEDRYITLCNHCDDMRGIGIKDHMSTYNLEYEERELIKRTLEKYKWDIRMVCKELSICRSSLLLKIQDYGLNGNN